MMLRISMVIVLSAAFMGCKDEESPPGNDAATGGALGGAGMAGTSAGSGGAGGTSAGAGAGATAGGTTGMGGSGAAGAGSGGRAGATAGAGGAGVGGSGSGGTAGAPRPCEGALVAEDKCPVCADDATCDAPTYTVNGDQTVTSSCCDLVWQQMVDTEQFDLADAMSYCASLPLAGGGWRLPTKDELLTLVVDGNMPPIDLTVFPGSPQATFWSSTPMLSTTGWTVTFHNEAGGFADGTNVNTTIRVRCVR